MIINHWTLLSDNAIRYYFSINILLSDGHVTGSSV